MYGQQNYNHQRAYNRDFGIQNNYNHNFNDYQPRQLSGNYNPDRRQFQYADVGFKQVDPHANLDTMFKDDPFFNSGHTNNTLDTNFNQPSSRRNHGFKY